MREIKRQRGKDELWRDRQIWILVGRWIGCRSADRWREKETKGKRNCKKKKRLQCEIERVCERKKNKEKDRIRKRSDGQI